MSRPAGGDRARSAKKPGVQGAVVRLRQALNMTQQQLAVAMSITVSTVQRWETRRPPSGLYLHDLIYFSLRNGLADIAEQFRQAEAAEEAHKRQTEAQLALFEEMMLVLRNMPKLRKDYLALLDHIEMVSAKALSRLELDEVAIDNGVTKYYADTHRDLQRLITLEREGK